MFPFLRKFYWVAKKQQEQQQQKSKKQNQKQQQQQKKPQQLYFILAHIPKLLALRHVAWSHFQYSVTPHIEQHGLEGVCGQNFQ